MKTKKRAVRSTRKAKAAANPKEKTAPTKKGVPPQELEAAPKKKAAPKQRSRKRVPRRKIRIERALPVIPVAVAVEVPIPVPGVIPEGGARLLTLNRKGDDVAHWQQFLRDHGFDPGPVDGFFGGRTRLATMAFQRQHHLTPDGIVGGRTRLAAGPLGVIAAIPLVIRGMIHGEDDIIDHIGGVPIFETSEGGAIYFKTGMTIDADGAYRAYKIRNQGLDYDDNGKNPCAPNGRWIGVVTDNAGRAIPQQATDPAPGYLISTTSLQDRTRLVTDPMRYVDSETIPYIVLPGGHLGRASLGDYAFVVNTQNGKMVHAIAADAGPKHRVGEASIAVARALLGEAQANPRRGGTERPIIRYVVFPGSADGRFPSSDPRETAVLDRTLMHLNTRAATLFAALDPTHQASLMT
jgi:peptidoglycan hydrolase-like protein with peptidoglycan-binding domain